MAARKRDIGVSRVAPAYGGMHRDWSGAHFGGHAGETDCSMHINYCLVVLSWATAYFVSGKIGLLFALPPGFATIIWPPSGIAVAGMIMVGYRLWPAIFLGSFLINVSVASSLTWTSVIVACGTGVGATFQAVAALWLIRLAVDIDRPLHRVRDIVVFLILIGPISCLINATWSVSFLSLAGIISLTDYAHTWAAWWFGDVYGVVNITLLTLAVAPRRFQRIVEPRPVVMLPIVFALIVTMVLFVMVHRWQWASKNDELREVARKKFDSIRTLIDYDVDVLASLVQVFECFAEITPDSFNRLAERGFLKHPGVLALSWAPKVSEAERREFEQAIQRLSGNHDFTVVDLESDNGGAPSGERSPLYPLCWIEPAALQSDWQGVNLGSDPVCREAMDKACDTGRLIAVVADWGPAEKVVIMFHPAYRYDLPSYTVLDRRQSLTGYAVGVYALDRMITTVMGGTAEHAVLRVRALTPDSRPLYASVNTADTASAEFHPDSAVWNASLHVGEQFWRFEFYRGDEAARSGYSWQEWGVIAGGAMFSGLLGSFLLLLTGTTTLIEAEVDRKTRELSAANTALVTARDAAESAALAKGNFLANMSHEIRTPMTGILGASDLLLKQDISHDQRRYVEMINLSSRSLLTVVNDILDYSKIDAGKTRIETVPCDLRATVEAIIDLLQPKAEEQGIRLQMTYPDSTARYFHGDATRIRQILINLVGNALKFTETGSVSVEVATAPKDDGCTGVQMDVVDTGIGIPEDQLEHIFDGFNQADISTTRKFGGSGLGLTISRGLAELMGGRLDVRSTVGKGSTFAVYLRLRPCGAGDLPGHDDKMDMPHRNYRKTVLVVEDTVINQKIAEALLRTLGLQVDIASTGKAAVRRCRERSYDVVLMDVHMPVMDGIEATRLIRETSDVMILAMTANVMEENRRLCLEAGMVGFLAKPFELEQIIATLDKAFQS